jgi:hypothetical protein
MKRFVLALGLAVAALVGIGTESVLADCSFDCRRNWDTCAARCHQGQTCANRCISNHNTCLRGCTEKMHYTPMRTHTVPPGS